MARGDKTTWVHDAAPEEKGSFSDRNTGIGYEVGNATDVAQAESAALDRGEDVVFVDESIDPNDPVGVTPGQNFAFTTTQEDGQGNQHAPKYGPGH